MQGTDMGTDYDVAVIGGGPGGSTIGTLLKKYSPDTSVVIFERDKFPRDHVGESQLPAVCKVLAEMDCWDKVEAAGFPIKIGATYKWGDTDDLWDFEFYPAKEFKDEPRLLSELDAGFQRHMRDQRRLAAQVFGRWVDLAKQA